MSTRNNDNTTIDNTTIADHANFCLWLALLPEVQRRILSFCSGRTLSTLSLASRSCPQHAGQLTPLVSAWARSQLRALQREILGTTTNTNATTAQAKYDAAAREWFDILLQGGDDDSMRTVSENLAVVDYLTDSLRRFTHPNKTNDRRLLEWPVWCGQITMDAYGNHNYNHHHNNHHNHNHRPPPHGGTTIRRKARVILTVPQLGQALPAAARGLLHHHVPSAPFRAEPYNLQTPLPPWGHVWAWRDTFTTTNTSSSSLSTTTTICQDQVLLEQMARQLQETGQVGVPWGYQSYPMLDVRILSAADARRRVASFARLRDRFESSFLLHHDDNKTDTVLPPLMCFWQEDDDDAECAFRYKVPPQTNGGGRHHANHHHKNHYQRQLQLEPILEYLSAMRRLHHPALHASERVCL